MCQKISIIDSLSLGMYCQYKLMTNWLFEPVPEEKKTLFDICFTR